jgi:hypothetical protein
MNFLILFFLVLSFLFSQETNPTEEAKNTSSEKDTKEDSSKKKLDETIKRLEELEENMKLQKKELEDFKKSTEPKPSTKFISPMKKNGVSPEYLRSILLEPEQMAKYQKNDSLWLNDIFRMGLQVRPRIEQRENTDFNSKTDDQISRQSLATQVWFLVDPHPNISGKITIQDSRLFGGSASAQNGDDRRYYFDATGNIINPQTYSANSNCAANTPITNSNFNTCMTPSEKNSTSVRSPTSIREAFVDFKNFYSSFRIRLGRQILAFGDQRIIGGANWLQNGLSFDGIRVSFEHSRFNTDIFGIKFASGQNYVGASEAPNGILTGKGRLNGSIDDAYLNGIYNTLKLPELGFNLDLYSIVQLKKWVPSSSPNYNLPNATVYPEDRQRQRDELYTTGFRFTNRTKANQLPDDKSFDWTLESAFQSGDTGQRIGASWDPLQTQNLNHQGVAVRNPYITEQTGNIYNQVGNNCGGVNCTGNANSNLYTEKVRYTGQFHVLQAGYTFEKKIRLGAQYLTASGNGNRNSGSNSTYQTIANPRFSTFPIWNNFSGISEMIDFKNVKSYSTSISYKSNSLGFFQLAYFIHDKAKKEDSWYGVGGNVNSGNSGTTEVLGSNPYFRNNNPFDVAPRLGKRIFTELDFTWMYSINEHVSFWFGAAYMLAGDAIQNERSSRFTSRNSKLEFVSDSFRKNSTVLWFMVTTVF